MPKTPDPLATWFERLVRYKMTALAIPISGMSVSGVLLTLSEILSVRVQAYVEDVGLALLSISAVLFAASMIVLVRRSLSREVAKPSPTKRIPTRNTDKDST